MKFETRVKNKIKKLEKEIIELEFLKEKFDSLELEKNIELASKLETIKIDLDNKKISFYSFTFCNIKCYDDESNNIFKL